jgi:hypothetical protein
MAVARRSAVVADCITFLGGRFRGLKRINFMTRTTADPANDGEPLNPKLHIELEEDESFARSATRWVGVGVCRRHDVAISAVRSLETLGYTVDSSPQGLCCGRPLYDSGFLDEAERRLERIVAAMRADIHAGVPLDIDALREGPGGPPAGFPELGYVPEAEASRKDS